MRAELILQKAQVHSGICESLVGREGGAWYIRLLTDDNHLEEATNMTNMSIVVLQSIDLVSPFRSTPDTRIPSNRPFFFNRRILGDSDV